MIRQAGRDDYRQIIVIRDAAGAERLSDPRELTDGRAQRLLEAGAVQLWQAPGEPITGFVGTDAATGAIVALLVAPGQQGRGIGRALLAAACDALRAAGCVSATITLDAGSPAARHYRAAGWTDAAATGQVVLWKDL